MSSTFYKDYFDKPTATSPPINTIQLIAKLSIKLSTKLSTIQKCDQLAKSKANGANKHTKKNRAFNFLSCF